MISSGLAIVCGSKVHQIALPGGVESFTRALAKVNFVQWVLTVSHWGCKLTHRLGVNLGRLVQSKSIQNARRPKNTLVKDDFFFKRNAKRTQ